MDQTGRRARALQNDIANPPDSFVEIVREARATGANDIVYSARLQRLTDLANEYDEFVDFTGTRTTTLGDLGGKPAMSINFPSIRDTALPDPTPFEFEGTGLNMTPTGTVNTGARSSSPPAGSVDTPPTNSSTSTARPRNDQSNGGDTAMVDELTPEDLGLERVESPQEAIQRLRKKRNRTEAEEVELFQARTKQRAARDDLRRMDGEQELAARQAEAGTFNLGDAQARPNNGQGGMEAAGFPARRVVPGDARYVSNIMGDSGYKRGQARIVSDGVNKAVDQILSGGPFPPGRNAGPIRIRNTDNTIQDGHHRLIAAHIVSRLTGRPLRSGPNRVIPEGWIEFVPPSRGDKEPKGWSTAGIE